MHKSVCNFSNIQEVFFIFLYPILAHKMATNIISEITTIFQLAKY